jgi:hypothetical protein
LVFELGRLLLGRRQTTREAELGNPLGRAPALELPRRLALAGASHS